MYDINQICRVAIDLGASDLHITAGSPPVLRIRGELRAARIPALSAEDIQLSVQTFLTPKQWADFEERKGLDFTFLVDQTNRFRANVYLQRSQISLAIRPIAKVIPTLDELGLPSMLKDLVLRPAGLLMITGPTGHGKSTTQAAMIDHINHHKRCHIITVEDPIEYLYQNDKSIIEQREVGMDVKSFSDALRMILRQDPDVVIVGEMRDIETIESTLRAAETGHLVIANLHANDTVGSLERLLNMVAGQQQGPMRVQLSMTLLAVLSQRLLPKADGKGRVAAMEVMMATDGLRHLIRDGRVHQIYSLMQTGGKDGMITFDTAVRGLYRAGAITRDVAQNYVRTPEDLDR